MRIIGNLIPFIGFRRLSREDVASLELDPAFTWQSFEIEWLNRGVLIWLAATGVAA